MSICQKKAVLLLVMIVGVCPSVCPSVHPTSIVVGATPDGIMIVADSRATNTTLSGKTSADDTKCKIVMLGSDFIFAETGSEGYTPDDTTDTLKEWHGTTEAINAFRDAGGADIRKVVDAWAQRISDHFEDFFLVRPARARQLEGLFGIFAGRNADIGVTAYMAAVTLDGHVAPVVDIRRILPKATPSSTHPITQELIDGQSDRAKSVAGAWNKESSGVPLAQKRVRWLEFLIEQTGQFDSNVGGPTNSIELDRNSPPTWINNRTCGV